MHTELKGKNILIGVTGGIAVYKICELIRRLKTLEVNLKVILTSGAEKFITPLLFSALSGERVYTNDDFFKPSGQILHIELASFPDIVLVAPATASFIGKLAYGLAEELLVATILATKASVYIFPSMNTNMWENPIVQKNVDILKNLGYKVYEPSYGVLACEMVGKGRLPEIEEIMEVTFAHFVKKNMTGKKVLITGGPTREFIDDVRFITNDSSGKTAFSIAREAFYRGAKVYLVWGGKTLPGKFPNLSEIFKIPKPEVYFVKTTREMLEVCKSLFPKCDIGIFAAAPCDFRPKKFFKGKIKKQELKMLEIELTEDIAQTLGKMKREDQITIGFALEQEENLEKYAYQKKREKNFDFIVANPPSAIGAEVADYLILTPKDKLKFTQVSKSYLARVLLDLIGM